jgi:cell division protein FtsL
MNKLQLFLVTLLVVCGFCLSSAYAADKLTADQQTILKQEFENIQLKNQIMQEAFTRNQTRMQEIARILQPYLADTTGAKAPS